MTSRHVRHAWLCILAAATIAASPVRAGQNAPTRSSTNNIIVFVGSSIFHRWTNLSAQMAPLPILNRAFDGAQTEDMLRGFDSAVLPSRPKVVVYYCGSNDVDAGDPAGAIFERIQRFALRVHTDLPDARLIFVSINRAPEKRDRWDVVDAVNRRVEAYAATTNDLQFVDVNPALFNRDGSPRTELYLSDQLHFRPRAYEEFARILKPVLTTAFAGGPLDSPRGKGATWTPPRTPDGQPDLQGTWTNGTLTPLERPAELAAKEYLTPQEAEDYQKRVLARWDRDNRGGGAEADLGRAYGSVWWDADARLVPITRTSLIVDPPEGKLPALTPDAQKRANDLRLERQRRPADGPEDRPLMDRCLWWPAVGPPMLPSFQNNSPYSPLVSYYRFVQGPGHLAIVSEILHETRIIPIDGRPHLSPRIRKWMGDSRGAWEGNTLVVDTTNFTGKSQFRGSGERLHLIERFTRTDPDTIMYEFTVDDPASFVRSWSVRVPMIRGQGPIIENACHEGNYGLRFLLGIARWEEQQGEPR